MMTAFLPLYGVKMIFGACTITRYCYSIGSWDGTAPTFRGIPMDSLTELYAEAFINWGLVESTYHIFEITPPQ